jgi:hypothetical protein
MLLKEGVREDSHAGESTATAVGASARVQHHPQDAVDVEPGMPEAGVGITHFVFGPRGSVPSGRQTLRTRTFVPLLVTVE